MRISDDRYSRDRQRFDLALRFIQHEARTRTIRIWTGLTDDRIRKLYFFCGSDLYCSEYRDKKSQKNGRISAAGADTLNSSPLGGCRILRLNL
jgi:hypothetical protein